MPSSTCPKTSISWERRQPIRSKEPDLIRLSSTRRFRSRSNIRSQKSIKSVKGPSLLRSSSRPLITFRPTPFRATRPKRIPPSETVKSAWDSFTSGGSSSMPHSLHSAMYSATFSLESSTEVSRAAIYSLGWWYLNQAV